MELHDEVGAVRRETILDCDVATAWERIRDLEAWLERDAEVEEEHAPRRLALRWADDDQTVIDVTLEPVTAARTRVVVVETPVRVLRAVSSAAVAASPRGPLMLA